MKICNLWRLVILKVCNLWNCVICEGQNHSSEAWSEAGQNFGFTIQRSRILGFDDVVDTALSELVSGHVLNGNWGTTDSSCDELTTESLGGEDNISGLPQLGDNITLQGVTGESVIAGRGSEGVSCCRVGLSKSSNGSGASTWATGGASEDGAWGEKSSLSHLYGISLRRNCLFLLVTRLLPSTFTTYESYGSTSTILPVFVHMRGLFPDWSWIDTWSPTWRAGMCRRAWATSLCSACNRHSEEHNGLGWLAGNRGGHDQISPVQGLVLSHYQGCFYGKVVPVP